MMKLIGVLLLLGVLDFTFARAGNINRDYTEEELTWITSLRDLGFSEEGIAKIVEESRADGAAAIAAAEGADITSLSEARGYEECEQFRKKVPKPIKSIAEISESSEIPKKLDKLETAGCGFGARRLQAAKWVSTEIDRTGNMESNYRDAFFRLFRYITGANDQGATISMTVPVINQMYMNSTFDTWYHSMSFYIPAEFQENTPVPTVERVEIEEFKDVMVYYRAFGGDDMSEERYKKELINLATALTNEGVSFYPYIAIAGGYTRPGYGTQRHEVMYREW